MPQTMTCVTIKVKGVRVGTGPSWLPPKKKYTNILSTHVTPILLPNAAGNHLCPDQCERDGRVGTDPSGLPPNIYIYTMNSCDTRHATQCIEYVHTYTINILVDTHTHSPYIYSINGYIHKYIYKHIHIYIYMYIHVYVCLRVNTRICTHVCIQTSTHICAYRSICVGIHYYGSCICHGYIYLRMDTHIYTHMRIHCMHMSTHCYQSRQRIHFANGTQKPSQIFVTVRRVGPLREPCIFPDQFVEQRVLAFQNFAT